MKIKIKGPKQPRNPERAKQNTAVKCGPTPLPGLQGGPLGWSPDSARSPVTSPRQSPAALLSCATLLPPCSLLLGEGGDTGREVQSPESQS